MLALQQYRADLHSCGQPLSEAASASSEGRYEVPPPYRCHACTAIAVKQQEYKDTPQQEALLWSARRV